MSKIILAVYILSISAFASAASFDCAKARTSHEKFICANAVLSEADEKMGAAYKEARTKEVVQGYVAADQKLWLIDYRRCNEGGVGKSSEHFFMACLDALKMRTAELIELEKAEIYTSYDGAFKDGQDQAAIIIFQRGNKFLIKVHGSRVTTPTHVGYCWNRFEATKKGQTFYAFDDTPIIIKKNAQIELVDTLPGACDGIIGGMSPGIYKLRK